MDIERIEKEIKHDKNLQTVYYGMARFLEYDKSPWDEDEFKSNRSVKRYCQDISKHMMIRSSAYSNLIRLNYPNHIRVSIHPHDNNSKFAVALFKQFGLNYCITPWHNVACKMLDGRVLLIRKTIVDKINQINKERLKLEIDSKVSIYSRSKEYMV